jgi:diguanylate cyclase (GGDEF)-like protein
MYVPVSTAARADSPRPWHGLRAVFQPIVQFATGESLGYEALVRGPEGSPHASPEALFRLAQSEADTLALEVEAARTAISAFAAQSLPGTLFVNFSPRTLLQLLAGAGEAMVAVLGDDMPPGRVVIELTEQTPVGDAVVFGRAMGVLRELGLRYALDDFGTGHANLDLLVQLTPHFIKLDKSLVRGVAGCSRRLEVMRTLVTLAGTLGARVIAEGIEEAEELAVLRDLGVPFGQGYYLGRPLPRPAEVAPEPARRALASSQIAVFPHTVRSGWSSTNAGKLLRPAPAVAPNDINNAVLALFHAHAELHALAVVDTERKPVGIINRQNFIDRYAAPFHRELYGKKPCILMANPDPVCFDKSASLETMAKILASENQRYLADGFIITEGGCYLGLGTGADLIRAVTEIRMEAARYANPLTFLPGNIPLNQHIDRLIEAGVAFHACYVDLNHFKPYNDQYGYWKGDEMLKGAAAILADACDPARDFLGHVGGDDFLVLYQSEDWTRRARGAIARFRLAARELYTGADREAGGIYGEDRRGHVAFFPTVTMAIGAVRVPPAWPSGLGGIRRLGSSHIGAAAAAAKREAKKDPDGFVLVDLRELADSGRLLAEARGPEGGAVGEG